MIKTIVRPALVLFVLLSVVTGIAYPLLTSGIAKTVFPSQAAGSLIVGAEGKAIGSRLIGQNFSSVQYFWGRPSATGPMPNNANASGGSNQGAVNPALIEAVKSRIEALRAADPGNTAAVPVDLVTASASGLDPHISPAAAAYQLQRVAKARGLSAEQVQSLIDKNTSRAWLGLTGQARVNVLELNVALDGAKKG